MPTYDYQCRSCDRVTEVIHSMTVDGPSVCEHCGGVLRRILYPAGIIFKGSGFYRTDSRASDGGGSSSPKPSGATSPTASKDSPSGSKDSPTGSSTPSGTTSDAGSSD